MAEGSCCDAICIILGTFCVVDLVIFRLNSQLKHFRHTDAERARVQIHANYSSKVSDGVSRSDDKKLSICGVQQIRNLREKPHGESNHDELNGRQAVPDIQPHSALVDDCEPTQNNETNLYQHDEEEG